MRQFTISFTFSHGGGTHEGCRRISPGHFLAKTSGLTSELVGIAACTIESLGLPRDNSIIACDTICQSSANGEVGWHW